MIITALDSLIYVWTSFNVAVASTTALPHPRIGETWYLE
jgi:hypothetical protein